MKGRFPALVVGIGVAAALTRLSDAQSAAAQTPAPAGAPASAAATGGTTGTVVETMNAGQYTYVMVDDGSKKTWAAAPQFAVAVGDKVVVPNGMPMRNFESKTLNRTFDVVNFVPGVQVVGGRAAAAQAAPAHGAAGHGMPGHGAARATPAAVDLANIRKADGGQTVAELFANKGALAGKEVVVRGRVVKFTPAVMGKNWMHVQDGSGSANDLTVSTSATAAVGNTVLVRGRLGTDKDLGFGYHYEVIVEDAAVAVE